ncbi:MAG TPA: hypothetical protein VG711_00630 [Phycisphaerales bacterium]|nr:hypothetical protein [Phycisphaerales bacterium]
MSDHISHECGVALVRIRKPISYYRERYGDPAWGIRKLYLLMEKQHNRGQDGAGIAVVKFAMPPGAPFMSRFRSHRHNALERIFDAAMSGMRKLDDLPLSATDLQLKRRARFLGEVALGHLRYGTHSGQSRQFCHPMVRKNITASRNLAIAGNFNMTNSAELFNQLVEFGLAPVGDSDTQIILERLGYFLDREHEHLHATMGPESLHQFTGKRLAEETSAQLNLVRILSKASAGWDGGYTFAGLLGNGDAFACRDPAGIRPGFFHIDDEVVAVASERVALASVFNVEPDEIHPINPGHILSIKHDGRIDHLPFTDPLPLRQCTFERIYFSRGNDPEIYNQRKSLGKNLAPRVLASINNDLQHAVFSFIPNTAEAAYMGLIEEVSALKRIAAADRIWARMNNGSFSRRDLGEILSLPIRAEKIAHKDQRLRTFITHDSARRDLVMHVYDITRGVVTADDTLVVLDDSIVRGTTLRESIITILSRLNPRKIIICSSAPPIMYPDCYGIDMSQLGRFIAFEAATALLKESGNESLLAEIERNCLAQLELPSEKMSNPLADLYGLFTLDQISAKVAQLVRPASISWHGDIEVIYQSIDGLRSAMPGYTGDWYFTGNYPTPGGFKVLNKSFLNWRNSIDVRAY